jgi:hypothetical protein
VASAAREATDCVQTLAHAIETFDARKGDEMPALSARLHSTADTLRRAARASKELEARESSARTIFTAQQEIDLAESFTALEQWLADPDR